MSRGIKVIRSVILLCLAVVILTPVLAKEINERKYLPTNFAQIVETLPLEREALVVGFLPPLEEAIKIKRIEIDLSEQRMSLLENDKIIKEMPVSSGKPGMETPVGQFNIHNKNLRSWSSYGLWMPYWMLIEPKRGIGIHELPEWPNGYKEGANHLGTPVSHGCIRLGVGDAKFVYDWAEVGTPVIIQF